MWIKFKCLKLRQRDRQREKRQGRCPDGWMRNVTSIIPNNKSGQNYQSQPFKDLDIFQRHPTNWEVFIQENLLDLRKCSGYMRWFRLGLPPTHIHSRFRGVKALTGQGKLWRLAAPLPEGVKFTWTRRIIILHPGAFSKTIVIQTAKKNQGRPVSQLAWICHAS